ncbi:hypothetical protein, partial [Escherichia coli]
QEREAPCGRDALSNRVIWPAQCNDQQRETCAGGNQAGKAMWAGEQLTILVMQCTNRCRQADQAATNG